jgi:hypothetical protein
LLPKKKQKKNKKTDQSRPDKYGKDKQGRRNAPTLPIAGQARQEKEINKSKHINNPFLHRGFTFLFIYFIK